MNQISGEVKTSINPVKRITALWALSEAALGGVLHALKIPFTGLFIGGSAVIFITLIPFFSNKRGIILKATLLVMVVKAMVSPHSPVNAYLAVAFQGLIGETLFLLIRSKKIAAFLLGFLSLLESSIQKILVITIVFGQNIWEAIDLFGKYVVSQFLITSDSIDIFSISLMLITLYICIHLSFGIIIGLWAPYLAEDIKIRIQDKPLLNLSIFTSTKKPEKKPNKNQKIWKNISIIFIISLATIIFILSYFSPVFEKSKGYAALVMILRSIMIMVIWYYLLGPFLLKHLRRFLNKKSTVYQSEVNDILNFIPTMKQIITHTWAETKDIKLFRRIPQFVEGILIYLLTLEFKEVKDTE